MIDKSIFIEYRENGNITDAYEVVLASENNGFGIQTLGANTVIYPNGTTVSHPSLGRYEKTVTLEENTVYTVSWRVTPNFGDQPKFVTQQIGPFDSEAKVRAVSDRRGSFVQGTRGTAFLRTSTIGGTAVDPDSVSATIYNDNGDIIRICTPERAADGFFACDWDIDDNQATGTYQIVWTYIVDGSTKIEVQEVVVAPRSQANPPSLYAGRILEFRNSLEFMLATAQRIPIYHEQAKRNADHKTFRFSFPRWNQTPAIRVYINNKIQQAGFTVDYFKGTVIFDDALTQYDIVHADYTFRWFTDEELDRFLSNATNLINLWPPVSRGMSLWNIEERYIPLVLYGAAVDAIRHMMMALQFQEPQMVFGGPEGAQKAYANLEGLKKNYEETWNKGLEQKKNGPYAGLTRTLVTPEFALPGGRSRWFRYLFSNGSGG